MRMLCSSTGALEREIFLTTLGWLQSSIWQCIFLRLYASGTLAGSTDFWAAPFHSLMLLAVPTCAAEPCMLLSSALLLW